MNKIESTLLLLKKGDEIMLAQKKRGFGKGKYNGVGGKLEPGETVQEAMIRECIEEIGVTPTVYEKYGENSFIEYYKGELTNLVFHLYIATSWEGDIVETEEMRPQWFKIDAIPYDEMFKDDALWLPIVLEGRKIKGNFEFDENWNLLSSDIQDYVE